MTNKKNILVSIIASLIIGVLFGVALIVLSRFLDVSFLLKWSLIIAGIVVIITNVLPLVNGIANIGKISGIVDLLFAALGIVLGIMMIFMQGTVITVIVSIYLIAFPIIRILLSGDWKNKIKSEWLRLLIGILLLVFLPVLINIADTVVKTLIFVAGLAVIGISVLLFVLSLISYLTARKKETANDDFIETSAEESEE